LCRVRRRRGIIDRTTRRELAFSVEKETGTTDRLLKQRGSNGGDRGETNGLDVTVGSERIRRMENTNRRTTNGLDVTVGSERIRRMENTNRRTTSCVIGFVGRLVTRITLNRDRSCSTRHVSSASSIHTLPVIEAALRPHRQSRSPPPHVTRGGGEEGEPSEPQPSAFALCCFMGRGLESKEANTDFPDHGKL
jgi:hypothetical protein